jgi:hypothetical protein
VDSTTIIAAIIGGIFGLIGTVLTLTKSKRRAKVLAGIFVVASIVLLLVLIFTEPFDTPSLKITSPLPASWVGSSVQVQGESHNIPAGNKIYIIVYVTAHNVNRYYPNLSPASVQANGDWHDSAVIGASNDVNATFFIFATLVNHQGQDAIEKYIKNSENNNNIFSGMLSLPEGITIYSMTGVIRGS